MDIGPIATKKVSDESGLTNGVLTDQHYLQVIEFKVIYNEVSY